MEVYRVKTASILPLGKQGENLAKQIQFDLSRWISNFGPGTVQLLHQRSGDETPYPVAVEQDGNLAVWTVTSADTAVAGTGRAELQYYVGDALAKSETWMTKVLPALGPASETPPEAQQGWVDQVLAQVARITGMTAQAVELPAGSAPTADYADGVLTIGIPLGGDVSEAQIAQAVAEYLANNPIAETDPTVPDWAKQPDKPSYTADEVGALPDTTHIPSTADDVNAEPAGAVSQHNVSDAAHSDIRLLIQGLIDRLNALADSDDTTLDQLSEVVAYIKSNRTLIEAITTNKVSVADIIDNLTTNVTNKPLSAAQGVALKAMIDAITIPTALPNPNALTFTGAVTGRYDGSEAVSVEIPSGGGGITVTNTAAVGQTVKITAVDENGQPTEWEAVDMASGGGGYKPLELLYETTLTEDVTDFQQEFYPCDEVELHIINMSNTDITSSSFHRVCPNKRSNGSAVSNYPIKLSANIKAGSMEGVYRFERHDLYINLFAWLSMRHSGNGAISNSVLAQTMWGVAGDFGGAYPFAYTDKIDFIHYTGPTLPAGVIIRIYGKKQG